jgi:hypothetical protein
VLATFTLALLAAALPGVKTPSGNVSCVATPAALHCDVGRSVYGARLQARCSAPPAGLDWHGFELTPTRRGEIACSGGVLVMGAVRLRTLAYGRTWRHGPYACVSRRAGLTCTNGNGHGLFVSRLTYRAW